MDELLNRILGYQLPQPNAPAYFEGDTSGIQRQAQQSGLLNAAMALLEAGGPSQQRTSLGQAISRGVGSYQQGVSGSFDQALKDMLASQQIKDAQIKRAEDARRRKSREDFESRLAGATTMQPTIQDILNTQSNIDPALLEGMSAQQVIGQAPKTQQMPDEAAANRAVMDFLRSESPVEYAKMAFKGSDEPEQVRMLRALLKDPNLMSAYLGVKGAGAPKVSVEAKLDMANREALFKEVDIPIVQGFTNAASSSREFAQVSDTINNLLKGAGGGKFVQVGTDVARNLGIAPGQVAVADLAQSLVTQAAPKMRAPGSGSTSDMEFKAYMSSIPSLATSEQGREVMSKYSRAFADRSAKLADYARKLARDDKFSFEAIQRYDASLGPVLKDDFYKFVPQAGSTVDFRTQGKQ